MRKTPVSDAAEPKFKELLGGRVGQVLIDTLRGIEGSVRERADSALVNSNSALKAAEEAKGIATTAASAKTDAAAALEQARGTKEAVDGVAFVSADGTEVKGAAAMQAMGEQLRRHTGLLADQLEGRGRAAESARKASEDAGAAKTEASSARTSATQAAGDAAVSREQCELAAQHVQEAAARHSQELQEAKGEATEAKGLAAALQEKVGGLKDAVRFLVLVTHRNGLITDGAQNKLLKLIGEDKPEGGKNG